MKMFFTLAHMPDAIGQGSVIETGIGAEGV
jgi:hypothetical protein